LTPDTRRWITPAKHRKALLSYAEAFSSVLVFFYPINGLFMLFVHKEVVV